MRPTNLKALARLRICAGSSHHSCSTPRYISRFHWLAHMLISIFQRVETVYPGSPTKAVESGKKDQSVALLGQLVY